MTQKEIGKIISLAIRKEKFIYINYINKQEEETKYWIAVYDILLDGDETRLKCEMYNPSKNIEGTLTTNLFLKGIQTATIIEFSHYDVPNYLLQKLNQYTGTCDWLEYDTDVRYLLNYYEQCNYYDKDPYQKEYCMIPGIDLQVLRDKKTFPLKKEQKELAVKICQKQLYQADNLKFCELAFSKLSIDKRDNKKYVVCYYNLNFNPKDGTFCLDETLRFNKSFLHKRIFEDKIIGDDGKSSLFQYSEMNVDEFICEFQENEDKGQEILSQNLRPGEVINTRPEIMLLERDIAIDLKSTFDVIVERDKKKNLNIPLKAFLGKNSRKDLRRKEPEIIICDNKINVDQTRVLYNALKQPVTYVQGPPGTGKTQTILNVVLNGFYNKKTVLVCSSNNKPVDGIIEKLSVDYNGESIPFPFLRLGNFNQERKAIERLRELLNFSTSKSPNEEKLSKIEHFTNSKNEKLKDILKRQEEYAQTVSYLDEAKKLKTIVGETDSSFANKVNETVAQLKNDLLQNPEVKNEELSGLFTSLEDDYSLKQWMYYSSLKCILTLQSPKFSELKSICETKDDEKRVSDFNRWLANDDNMCNLVKAFPIIFTTNISSRRLGSPNFMFDLVIMDEAGQCNVAHSLIPITKANSLLLVGDPRQLKPIIVLEDSINSRLRTANVIPEDYDYKHNSILDIMRDHDKISQYVLLKYHYRCAKKIIEFSNKKYYDSALNLSSIKDNGALTFVPVKNKNMAGRNSAYDEAKGIIEYLKRNSPKDALIITPFVNQRELINSLLKEEGITDIECGTVHSMQGGEKRTIILSTALSHKTSQQTFEWIKNNTELINVAVTRAKQNLIVFSDDEAVSLLAKGERSDLVDLIQYVKSDGKIEYVKEALKLELAKSNGSYYENEFYKTITQFCSVHDSFETRRNIPFSDFFADDEELKNDKSEFDCILYEKKLGRKYPKIVIEINGGEHFGDKSREKADNRKREICKKKGLQFFMISNSFVKSYEQIRNIILNSKKAINTQMSLFENLDYWDNIQDNDSKEGNDGYCIRCGKSIVYNVEVPYCKSCYFSWKKSKEGGYFAEKHCHSCGKENTGICIYRPLCKTCYKES